MLAEVGAFGVARISGRLHSRSNPELCHSGRHSDTGPGQTTNLAQAETRNSNASHADSEP